MICSIMQRLGFFPGAAEALKRLYRGFLRRIRTAGYLSKEFLSSNLMFQGDSLTMVGVNWLFSFWVRRMQNRVPGMHPAAYIDDAISRAVQEMAMRQGGCRDGEV